MVERGQAEKAENGAAARLRQRYPTVEDLRSRARRRVPRFGFDFVDGGANEEYCVDRNTAAFQQA
jgi:L-lactate dehydrogenase (cytochrome)